MTAKKKTEVQKPETTEQPKFAVLLKINISGQIANEVFITNEPNEVPPQVNAFVKAFNEKQDVIWFPNPSMQNGYRVSHVSSYHVSQLTVEPKAEIAP